MSLRSQKMTSIPDLKKMKSTVCFYSSGKLERREIKTQHQQESKKIELQKETNQHLTANHEEFAKISKHMENQNTMIQNQTKMFETLMEFIKGKNTMTEQIEDNITIDDDEQEEQKRMEDKRKNEH